MLDPADPDYKQKMFDRARYGLRFKEGMRVREHGSSKCGVVREVVFDPERVIWENDKPHFIIVDLDNGESWSYNVHQLTTKRVKK